MGGNDTEVKCYRMVYYWPGECGERNIRSMCTRHKFHLSRAFFAVGNYTTRNRFSWGTRVTKNKIEIKNRTEIQVQLAHWRRKNERNAHFKERDSALSYH